MALSTASCAISRIRGAAQALKLLFGNPSIQQVTDAVHRVLEEGGGCEHEHPDRWIDEGDDVEGETNPASFPT
jgi:hypothetical protein